MAKFNLIELKALMHNKCCTPLSDYHGTDGQGSCLFNKLKRRKWIFLQIQSFSLAVTAVLRIPCFSARIRGKTH